MYAIIRIRGVAKINHNIEYTMNNLKLTKKNHLVLYPEDNSIKGMLKKAEGYITWGEVDVETTERLLKKRGLIKGDKKITEEFLKEIKVKNFKDLAERIQKGESLRNLGIKPVFRLNNPTKGFERKGIKKHFNEGGVLGYRGKKINELIRKMA